MAPSKKTSASHPIVREFLQQLCSDLEAGSVAPLEDYLNAWPEMSDSIPGIYLATSAPGKSTVAYEIDTDPQVRADASDADSGARYTIRTIIGEGGMGRVYLATDRTLSREVAIKYSRDRPSDGGFRERQLIKEAMTLARLSHPNIPPVHDLGVDSSGRSYYVMTKIEGRPLSELLSLRARHPRKWNTPRLLALFVQTCSAVEHAHKQNTLHLDLKPSNIMIGNNQELYVVDWGLAQKRPSKEEAVKPDRIAGTPAYMSPEQARGDPIDHRSDVFSLSCILWEIVTATQPFGSATASDLLARVRAGQLDPVTQWDDHPIELRDLCLEGLSLERHARPGSARVVGERVREFLEGARSRQERAKEAKRAYRGARHHLRERSRLQRDAAQLEATIADKSPPEWWPPGDKLEYWALEDQQRTLADRAQSHFDEATRFLQEALSHNPDDATVKRALASTEWERFEKAESRSESFLMEQYESRLRALDIPKFNEALRGHGQLRINLHPLPKRVVLRELVEENRRLVPGRTVPVSRPNDRTLLVPSIPMGRYQIELRRQGFHPIVAPINIARSQQLELRWKWYPRGEIGRDFVLIPAGPFLMGGDGTTMKSVDRCMPSLPDFAFARYPVTFGEYSAFLRHQPTREARARIPRVSNEGQPLHFFERDPKVRLLRGAIDRQHHPVFGINWNDAKAFARWRSKRDGRRYRLPTDREWEKAARGTDGRIFPWGDQFDAAFCKNPRATEEKAQPAPVGQYSTDRSVYGAQDLAGGVCEWCESWYSKQDRQRLLRGGYWIQPSSLSSHCAYRNGAAPEIVTSWIGFRLAFRL